MMACCYNARLLSLTLPRMQKQHNQECLGFFEMACAGICNSEKRCGSSRRPGIAVRMQMHCSASAGNVGPHPAQTPDSLRRLVPLYKECVLGEGQGSAELNLAGELLSMF